MGAIPPIDMPILYIIEINRYLFATLNFLVITYVIGTLENTNKIIKII